MHQELEGRAGMLFLENGPHHLVGLAGMHHQRQAGAAGGFHMDPEHPRLDVPGAQIVVEIETGLADADHLRTRREIA